MENSRRIVLEMLMEITSGEEYSHIVMKNVLDKYDYMDSKDKAFMKRLCGGTVERQLQLDYVLNQFSSVATSKMKPVIRNILRMGVYQILFMDNVPDAAACNESVKLTEKKKFGSLKGFVNGVLRNISRNKGEIVYPDPKNDFLSYLSVTCSMPEWIVKEWLRWYDKEVVYKICRSFLLDRDLTVRMRCEDEKEVLCAMEKEGIEAVRHAYLPYAYMLKNLQGLQRAPGFCEGKYTVQDVSSMLVAEIAGLKKGQTVLDVCAAPGGKTFHLADKLEGSGLVEAWDLTQYKVELLEENKTRLRMPNVCCKVRDARVLEEAWVQKADVVLADLPCSGLGVIGRKQDIKYRVTKDSIEEIALLQRDILKTVQAYVKPQGVLIYSTCTISRRENEENLSWFLENFPFAAESIEAYLPDVLKGDTAKEGYLQLLPGVQETDGFFMARLRRKE